MVLMCTGITVTRQYVPCPRRTNKAGSKIEVHMVVTMESLSTFSSTFPSMLKEKIN